MEETRKDSLFVLYDSLINGDYSVLDITPDEINSCCRRIIEDIVDDYRSNCVPYVSGYYLNKEAIRCAFDNNASTSCPQFNLVMNRLALIDDMYSTQMWRRPYGIEELAEVICGFGTDSQLRSMFDTILINHDISIFHFACSSNLFTSGFGTEKHVRSQKRAMSIISKYAYFLTSFNFPIYDSLVKSTYPLLWRICCPGLPLPPLSDNIVDYAIAIDRLRNNLGGLTYDEIDYILWHVGKILKGSLSLVLSMNDYLSIPKGFDIKTANLSSSSFSFLKKNKALYSIFLLAQVITLYN